MAWWRGHCHEQEQRHLQRVNKLIAENRALVQRVQALEGVLRQYAHLHFGRKTEQGGLPGAEPGPVAAVPAIGEQGMPLALPIKVLERGRCEGGAQTETSTRMDVHTGAGWGDVPGHGALLRVT